MGWLLVGGDMTRLAVCGVRVGMLHYTLLALGSEGTWEDRAAGPQGFQGPVAPFCSAW